MEEQEHEVDEVAENAAGVEKKQWSVNWYSSTPQQCNNYNCGMFVCMYTICIFKGIPIEELNVKFSKIYRDFLGVSTGILTGIFAAFQATPLVNM
jgi:Ulp1 protease family, C-terminal catalytic domain